MASIYGHCRSQDNEGDEDIPVQANRRNRQEQNHATRACFDNGGSREALSKEIIGQVLQYP